MWEGTRSVPCVCVSGSLLRGLLRRRLSGFLPPGLPTPPPDPIDPSDGACDLLLHRKKIKLIEAEVVGFGGKCWRMTTRADEDHRHQKDCYIFIPPELHQKFYCSIQQ